MYQACIGSMHAAHVTEEGSWADILMALPPNREDMTMQDNAIEIGQHVDGQAYAPILGTLGAFAAMMTIAMFNAAHVAMTMMG